MRTEMRPLVRALAISGACIAVVALSPAIARSADAAQTGGSDAQASGNAQTNVAAPAGAIVAASDLKKALTEIKISWRTYDKCNQVKLCGAYFDSFGVGITFGDGSIAPFIRAQRLTASEHDCIVNARAALERGDRGLAVQWVMAAKLQMSPSVRNWLGDHPDAVVAALRSNCCF
jgi:hypothetical protein